MLETTKRLGGENYVLWGGREGYETLLNTDLAREEASSRGSCTWSPSTSTRSASRGCCSSSRSPRSRRSTSTTTTPRPSTASSPATAWRTSTGSTSRSTTRRWPGTASTTRSRTPSAHGIFGSIDANRGDYQNGWDTDQFPNSVDELSLAVYEILRAGGFTTGGFNFDTKLRRQSMDRTDLFHAHIGGIDTLARSLLVAADMIERETLERLREERYAGWDGRLGPVDPRRRRDSLDLARGPGQRRRDRSAAGVRAAGAARERGEPGDLGCRPARASRVGSSRDRGWASSSGSTSRPPRRRPSSWTRPGPSAGSARRSTGSTSHGRCGASRTRGCGGTGGVGAIRSVLATTGVAAATIAAVGLTGQMHGLVLLDAGDGSSGPAILWNDQRTAAECDAIRAAVGPERLIEITGNDALTGFTAPKLVWVRDHEPEVWRARVTYCCRRTTSGSGSPASTRWTRPTVRGRILFDLAARDWSPRSSRRSRSIRRGCRRPSRARRSRARISAGRGRRPACGPARRSSPVAATRRPTRSGSGRSAGHGGAVAGDVRRGLRDDRPAARRAARRGPRLLPRGPGSVAPDVGDALRGRQPALVPGCGRPGVDFGDLVGAGRRGRRSGSEGCCSCRTSTGERSPHPDPLARGAFVGLTVSHDRRHLTRAVLEGVAFGLRDGLDLMIGAGMPAPTQIRASGGGTASSLWRQILADVLGAEIATVSTTEGAAYGAGLLAAVGAGWFPAVEAAADALVRVTPVASPGPDAPRYAQAHAIYRDLYPALAPIFPRL